MKPKVGDIVYVRDAHCRNITEPSQLRERKVLRVGRLWVTIEHGDERDERFALERFMKRGSARCHESETVVYRTRQVFADERLRNTLHEKFYYAIMTPARFEAIPLENLCRAARALGVM